MNINDRFNKERARKLNITGLVEGSLVEYCAKCSFQLHPEVKALRICPVCKAPLVAFTLTKEMIALISGELV